MYVYAPNGIVADIVAELPNYHPDLVAQYLPLPGPAPTGLSVGWLFNGTTYTRPPKLTAPAVLPDVSSAQAKIQLLRAKFLVPVQEAVKAIGGEVEIWFNDARTWQRNNPHVVEIGNGLNLSPDEIDELFREAAKIDA